jgi:hypothetical protein
MTAGLSMGSRRRGQVKLPKGGDAISSRLDAPAISFGPFPLLLAGGSCSIAISPRGLAPASLTSLSPRSNASARLSAKGS